MAIPDDRREAFLALDTSSPLVSVALAKGGSVICQRATEIRRSSERLIEMIDSVLGEADLRLAELAGIGDDGLQPLITLTAILQVSKRRGKMVVPGGA